ncbi:uncharacterized protein [Chelonus insularis]|uniref:uncharacterized protein n=1 Tax=Chelonus insularis TaxID=460826 RepID=UPI0015895A65|nr:uncharacterized protein LOC118065383 [Chelonus insularis]XP_034936514.1 uncharacterized protein LOC118065383 [Chelonus insularis]XP_034936515.1 uncharacterized protein LOC118065383 [Chelonus insularis]XP_034936516.1 uncharacterized protein LOC118065383 [Chelonus insularis]XP_034936518.1 uncharacterized protein LOC118065383 [Chelonus insularis]
MDLEDFEHYSLSEESKNKLKIHETLWLNQDLEYSNSIWQKLFPIHEPEELNNDKEESVMEIDDLNLSTNHSESTNSSLLQSSQFFFTQVKKCNSPISSTKRSQGSDLDDRINAVYESLETNKILDIDILKNLSDEELLNVFENLSQRLDIKGIFDLCNSICEMDVDEGIQYIKIICSKLLLPKITELKEPSRQLSVIILKMVKKFSEDIKTLIYIPLINVDLQETSIMSVIIQSYQGEQKMTIISDFLMNVKELKLWHISILPGLIDSKVENSLKDRLLTLLAEKATTFSKDKNYGKFILSFIKTNPPYSQEQKNNLDEIAAVNETIFKKAIEKILQNMYHHRDLWHIN